MCFSLPWHLNRQRNARVSRRATKRPPGATTRPPGRALDAVNFASLLCLHALLEALGELPAPGVKRLMNLLIPPEPLLVRLAVVRCLCTDLDNPDAIAHPTTSTAPVTVPPTNLLSNIWVDVSKGQSANEVTPLRFDRTRWRLKVSEIYHYHACGTNGLAPSPLLRTSCRGWHRVAASLVGPTAWLLRFLRPTGCKSAMSAHDTRAPSMDR